MNNFIKVVISGSALLLVAACGGSSSSSSGSSSSSSAPISQSPSTPSYEKLTSTASKTSTIGGYGTYVEDGVAKYSELSGSIEHSSGKSTVTDGTYTLVDNNGLDSNGDLTNGAATVSMFTTTDLYEYVGIGTFSYPTSTGEKNIIGYLGILTDKADVPTSGTATYNGLAFGALGTVTKAVHTVGSSNTVVNVDFGGGSADMTISDLLVYNSTTGQYSTSGQVIDKLEVDGMKFLSQGNVFGGGTVSTTLNGQDIDVLGANSTGLIDFSLFGYDETNATPDEVAGLVTGTGDNGTFIFTVIAD